MMSFHLDRSLCATCLRLGRYRRFYVSQAVRLRIPHSQQLGHTAEREDFVGPSTVLTTGWNEPDATPHNDVVQRTRTETYNGRIAHSRNPLAPNKVDLYLASLHDAKPEPTLADIERCRPQGHSDPGTPQYEEDYRILRDTLCRSFTKVQLRRFADLYNLPKSRSVRKLQHAENIMEKQWKWPSLKEIEKMKKDTTEVSTKSFNVSPSELFLVLGKDGADLLQLSTKYNLHISLTSDPLALRVEGLRGSLKKFTEHISRLKSCIIEDSFKLPTEKPIRADLLQRISRLSGAFIENVGNNGEVRICVKNVQDLVSAKRLATRATCEASGSHILSLYAPAAPPDPSPEPTALYSDSYALYPFSSPRPLPWTMETGGSFRVRRVGEWLGVDFQEDIQKTGGLAGNRGMLSTFSQQTHDLKALMCANNSISFSRLSSITASFGHVLLTPPANTQRMSITSPLEGHQSQPEILKWLHDKPLISVFLPSLPYDLLNSTPFRQRYLHRLVYHALPTSSDALSMKYSTDDLARNLIKCEVVLSQEKFESLARPSVDLEMHARSGISTSLGPGGDDSTSIEDSDSGTRKTELLSRFWAGSETIMNVMMPDRPCDVQFSRLDFVECHSGQEPRDLHNYISELQQYLNSDASEVMKPDPPLTVNHHGQTYVLHTSAGVRQCLEPIHGMVTPDCPSAEAIIENILDLESDHKSTTCQVICSEHDSEEAWRTLLSSCDRLTTVNTRRQVDDWASQELDT